MNKTKKIKIIFFGSSDFSVYSLKELFSDDSIEVCSVITKKDKKSGRGNILHENIVAVEAEKLDIPVIKVSSLLKNPTQLESIDWTTIDYAVVVSFGYILPNDILCQLPNRFINLHASLLPEYRGPSPIHSSIINGDTKMGNSIMILEEAVDSGPVLSTQAFSVSLNETIEDIYPKMAKQGAKLLVSTIKRYFDKELTPVPQDHSKATFTKMITKEDGFITLKEPALELYNKYRAFKVWPTLFTTLKNLEEFLNIRTKIEDKETIVKLKDIALKKDSPLQELSSQQIPSGVIQSQAKLDEESESKMDITRDPPACNACSVSNAGRSSSFDKLKTPLDDGGENGADFFTLQILKLQLPNKPAISYNDFINGYKI